ncbi:MAG: hypothetical protein H3C35_00730 [Bacteroidetes bacterium]|nr:hypothetical protein [Bacteroidota bacterium]
MTLIVVLAIISIYVVTWAIVAIGKNADRDMHEALFNAEEEEQHCIEQ